VERGKEEVWEGVRNRIVRPFAAGDDAAGDSPRKDRRWEQLESIRRGSGKE
jgi:hypothetical protein